MGLSFLDILFIAIVAIAALRVTFKGFVEEVLSFAAFVLGITASILFSSFVEPFVEQFLGAGNFNGVIAFLIVFIVVYILVKLLEGLLKNLLDRLNLDNLDRALGFFFGIVEGLLIVIIILYVLQIQPIFDVSVLLAESKFASVITAIIPLNSLVQ